MSKAPPREWFEEKFVYGGEITYCSLCKAIPLAFIGHDCTNPFYGLGGRRVTVPYRWEDVTPVGNDDRPGNWMLMYFGPECRSVSDNPKDQT